MGMESRDVSMTEGGPKSQFLNQRNLWITQDKTTTKKEKQKQETRKIAFLHIYFLPSLDTDSVNIKKKKKEFIMIIMYGECVFSLSIS